MEMMKKMMKMAMIIMRAIKIFIKCSFKDYLK